MQDRPPAVTIFKHIIATWPGFVALGTVALVAWKANDWVDERTVAPSRLQAVEAWKDGHDTAHTALRESHMVVEHDVDALRGNVKTLDRNIQLVLCQAPFISRQILYNNRIDCQKLDSVFDPEVDNGGTRHSP